MAALFARIPHVHVPIRPRRDRASAGATVPPASAACAVCRQPFAEPTPAYTSLGATYYHQRCWDALTRLRNERPLAPAA